MNQPDDDRHLNWFNLLSYLEADVPAAVAIAGNPRLQLIIEPSLNRIAIRAPLPSAGQVPDLTAYRHLDTKSGADSDGNWIEFGATGTQILREAYPVLVAVADYMQSEGYDMGAAIGRALEAYHRLLSALGRMSDHQELGLLGELLILEKLITSIGGSRAIAAWRGPEREEHDFGFQSFDVEVKTTLTEDRVHQVGSLTQLEPSLNRDLWLISIQLTAGGIQGVTLPEMIDRIAAQLLASDLSEQFFRYLHSLSWDDGQRNLYIRTFALRGPIYSYRITSEFPALTASKLSRANYPIERLTRVSYGLHIAGIEPDVPPLELMGVVES